MQGEYKTLSNLPRPPAYIKLSQITTERVELYHQVPPHGEIIPIEEDPFLIDDSIPSMDDIDWVVCHLRRHRLGGASGIGTNVSLET